MPPPDTGGLAVECLPGRGEVKLERLGQGLFNDTYHAHRGARQFVLRITREPMPAGRAARDFEARLVANAAASGLAPPLVHADASRGILVLEWLPGHPWDAASIGAPERIGQAARLIRRVHALAVPQPARVCSPAGWADFYRRALAPWPTASEALSAPANRLLGTLAALPAEAPVVCHSDLHRLNVLTPEVGGVAASVLLDWEYAHLSEPGWDLAGWSANNDFTAAQSRALLGAYRGSEPDPAQWRRFALLRWLFDYVCVLWIRLYQRSNPPDSPALGARAELLETRLTAAVCGKLVASDEPFSLET